MALGRKRDEQKERQWRGRIAQWRASGLSVRGFCAQDGLAPARFYHWRLVIGVHSGFARRLPPVVIAIHRIAKECQLRLHLLVQFRLHRIANKGGHCGSCRQS